jgi:putative FmdB family regulatory protein
VPTYAYACTACGHAFDAVQKFSDAALTECPECGGRLRKVYTSIGVTFKGPGFYRNDSRASSNGSSKSTDKSGDSSTSSSTEKSASRDSTSKESATSGSSASSTSSAAVS